MPSLMLHLAGLEIARGYDGLLRGDPEPTVLLANYAVLNGTVLLVGRQLFPFTARGPFPTLLNWPDDRRENSPSRETMRTFEVPEASHFVLVAVAMEEDSGDDIARIFADLEDTTELLLWELDGESPSPMHLTQLDPAGFVTPRRVEIENDTGALSSSCRYDKWVSASAWIERKPHACSTTRVHLRSRLRRNDWTLLVETTLL